MVSHAYADFLRETADASHRSAIPLSFAILDTTDCRAACIFQDNSDPLRGLRGSRRMNAVFTSIGKQNNTSGLQSLQPDEVLPDYRVPAVLTKSAPEARDEQARRNHRLDPFANDIGNSAAMRSAEQPGARDGAPSKQFAVSGTSALSSSIDAQ